MVDRPLVITVAPNGARALKSDNAAVPYTPAEIAREIIEAAECGAAIAHVHSRTADGGPSIDAAAYREIIERVRDRSDIVLELSMGTREFAASRALQVLALEPEMASLPMEARLADGGDRLGETARQLLGRRIRPFLAATSVETLEQLLPLMGAGLAGPVPCVALSVEPASAFLQTVEKLAACIRLLPPEAQWWLMKSGRTPSEQLRIRAVAVALGGHVRVGFEDCLQRYDDSGPAPSNGYYVRRMAELAAACGRRLATPQEARRLLDLG